MDGINWHSFYFLLFGLLSCVFAVAVTVTGNVVRMAFYLTLCLGATAGLFFLAGAGFVGAMQLLIYVGGTLVLLIFGVMLTAQGPFVNMKTRAGELVIGGIVGASLLGLLLQAAFRVDDWHGPLANTEVAQQVEKTTPGELGVRLLGKPQAASAESKFSSGYLLPFEIVSIHLLVVLIGSAYLARTKRRRRSFDESQQTG